MTDDSATLRAMVEELRADARAQEAGRFRMSIIQKRQLADAIEASQSSWAKEKAELERTLHLVKLRMAGFISAETRAAIVADIDAALARHASRPVTVKD